MQKCCKLIAHGGGGIFSIFMDIIIPNIYESDADGFKIEIGDNQYNPPPNCFDFVFDQPDVEEPVIECRWVNGRGFRKGKVCWGSIEKFKNLPLIKAACKKFVIRSEVTKGLIDIPTGTLGVHFRGRDMNERHPRYGVFNYDDYYGRIRRINPKQIFIASDNNEVIERMEKDFKVPVFFYDDFIRGSDAGTDTYAVQMENAGNERFWREAFIDMLTLSRCGSLLCRVSGFANAAISYSDDIKVFRL